MKRCKKCGDEKSLLEFHRSSASRDGLQPKCKPCSLSQSRIWHIKNRERRAAYDAERAIKYRDIRLAKDETKRCTAVHRAKSLFMSARRRNSESFTLTFDHVLRGIEAGFCPVTGLAFDLRPFESRRSGKRCNPFAPSLDRIDSNKGYSDENTRIVIWQFNHMKGELSDAELRDVCRAFLERTCGQ